MLAAALDHDRDVPALRRPDAERDAAVRDLGSDRIAPPRLPLSLLSRRRHAVVLARETATLHGASVPHGRGARQPWNHRSPCGIRELSSRRASRLHHRNEEPNASQDLVEARHRLSDLSPLLPGLERRRHRRPQGHLRAARLSRLARRRRDLDFADLSLADGRFRLRRRRLLRHRSALRRSRRLRPA